MRLPLLAAAAVLLAASAASAQELPCGEPAQLEYVIQWRAPAYVGAGVSGYALFRGPTSGQWSEGLPLVPGAPVNGVLSARVGGFSSDQRWVVAVVALGQTAEDDSVPSNELIFPALLRGRCSTPTAPLEVAGALYVPPVTPPPSAWPSAANTGVPAGVTLRPCPGGTITSSQDGCRFTSAIVIAANNVTIENSEVVVPLSTQYAISDGGTARTGTVLRNLRVSGATGKCIYLSGGNWTGDKLDVSGCEDGVFGSRFTLTNSYIHDVLTGGSRHSDGVQIPSVGQVTLRGNRIEVAKGAANSAIFVQSNFGQVNGVTVEGNLLGGGTYTVYTDAQGHACPINVTWRNNTVIRNSYAFGVRSTPCAVTWTGNVYDDGAAIP